MSEDVYIVGLGANTAVGRSAWATAAAVRAGISGFTQHPYMIDTAGEPMRAAIAPWIDIGLQGVDRFEALLFPAIEEALSVLGRLPSDAARWAGLPADLGPQLVARLSARYKDFFGSAAAFSAGHAAGLLGVQAACTKLRQGALDACVVAGVESWIEPETLEWLEESDQLHGAGPFNNAWGFIPGEAGAALLLMRESVVKSLNLQALACVLAVGSAHEPKRIKAQTVCIGEGLTAAFRDTLAALPAGALVTDIYCDMNGEPHRADEFGFTALRTKEHFESLSDFHAPADIWGDVSAAGALLHLGLACVAARKQYARGPYAFAWASAEMGERAAALVACAIPADRRT
jgi:3-oxoacyl-[acyl-carrier-protein] synthase-1